MKIGVSYSQFEFYPQALALSQKLELPLIEPSQLSGCEIALFYQENYLSLFLPNTKPLIKPLYIDFLHGKINYRCRFGGGKNQALIRAVGLHKHKNLKIIDATAGLGSDAFILAFHGAEMRMIERNQIISALLEDGLKRAKDFMHDSKLSIQLINDEAKAYLTQLKFNQCPDVIYLDPMFPKTEKNALNKIPMRLLAKIVGKDEDADELLEIALQRAKSRVVVKRPRIAPFLANKEPDLQITGKSNRFDIYTRRLSSSGFVAATRCSHT